MNHGSLFSGIGGFDLAAEWMGWNNAFHCEINPFGQYILKHYWPNAKSYIDIKTTDFSVHRGQIDILSGGFPCQPYSQAGKRKGKDDDRHLWPEMLRAIREIQPRYVVGENVRGLTNWNGGMVFDEVQADLEAEGYEVLPFLLPACGVGAPHRRDRIWFFACHPERTGLERRGRERFGFESRCKSDGKIIANTDNNGYGDGFGKIGESEKSTEGEEQREERNEIQRQRDGTNASGVDVERDAANSSNEGLQRGEEVGNVGGSREKSNEQSSRFFRTDWKEFPTQPPVCFGNDGFPAKLVRIAVPKKRGGSRILTERQALGRHRIESIKAAGNAIVPQVVFQIFKAIEQYENKADI